MLAHRTRILTAVALTLGLFGSATILASTTHAEDIRARGKKACQADADQLCATLPNKGDAIVLKCLQDQRTQLSKPCHEFLTEVGQLK